MKIPSQNVTVYGAGWTAYRQRGVFLDGFQTTKDGTLQLMLLHAKVDSGTNTEGHMSIQPEQIASSGLDLSSLRVSGGLERDSASGGNVLGLLWFARR